MALTFDMKTNPFMPHVNAFVSSLGQYTKFMGDMNEKEYKLTKEREGQSLMNAYMQSIQGTNDANELTATTNEFYRLAISKGLEHVIPYIKDGQTNQATNIAYREQTAINQIRVDTLRNTLSNEDFIDADGSIIKGKEFFARIDSKTDDPNLRIKEYESGKSQILTTKYSVQTNEVNGKSETTITANKFNPITGEAILGKGTAYRMFKDKDGAMRMMDREGNIKEIPLEARIGEDTLRQQQLNLDWARFNLQKKAMENHTVLYSDKTGEQIEVTKEWINGIATYKMPDGKVLTTDQINDIGWSDPVTSKHKADESTNVFQLMFSSWSKLVETSPFTKEKKEVYNKYAIANGQSPTGWRNSLKEIYPNGADFLEKYIQVKNTRNPSLMAELVQSNTFLKEKYGDRLKINIESGHTFLIASNGRRIPIEDVIAEGVAYRKGIDGKMVYDKNIKDFVSGLFLISSDFAK